jgi:peptide deformylase
MSILQIRTFPDQVLKESAKPVHLIDGSFQKLVDNMIETMYAAYGLGLAAPQVGESQKLIVVEAVNQEETNPLMVIVNPEIVALSDETIEFQEGCLSIPSYRTTVKRAKNIGLKGFDREGKPIEIEASGLLARALQHEVDHINGVLFIDRIGAIKRNFFLKRFIKNLKKQP